MPRISSSRRQESTSLHASWEHPGGLPYATTRTMGSSSPTTTQSPAAPLTWPPRAPRNSARIQDDPRVGTGDLSQANQRRV